MVANQIDLICVPQLTSAEGWLAAQNGGSRAMAAAAAAAVWCRLASALGSQQGGTHGSAYCLPPG
jgi:hypothetical protein